MPWKESRILDQRLQFLSSYQKEEMSVADLCREYGISRPTGYRWINRYNETGPEGLVDRSRRPHSCSHATLEPIENTILVLRAKHPSWGRAGTHDDVLLPWKESRIMVNVFSFYRVIRRRRCQ